MFWFQARSGIIDRVIPKYLKLSRLIGIFQAHGSSALSSLIGMSNDMLQLILRPAAPSYSDRIYRTLGPEVVMLDK